MNFISIFSLLLLLLNVALIQAHNKGSDGQNNKDQEKNFESHHSKDGHDKKDEHKSHDKGDKKEHHHEGHHEGHHNMPTKSTPDKTDMTEHTIHFTLPTTNNPTSIKPPNDGFCAPNCKQTYCKKKTICSYEVISIKEIQSDKIIFNIKIVSAYKGLPGGLKDGENAILEVPKSNKKHKIEPNKQFLLMSSQNEFKNGRFSLQSNCYNKQTKLLSLVEIAFLNNKPNDHCEKEMNKCDCRVKKCIKKCCKLCEECDDAETCCEDCAERCKSYHNHYLHKEKKPKRS